MEMIHQVSTLVVEWIEISINEFHLRPVQVSTLVVEWIEITDMKEDFVEPLVSTLVVEWIEIPRRVPQWYPVMSLHPRGGVD